MLSQSSLETLGRLSREPGIDSYVKERVLMSKASPAQQVKVYGYWRKTKRLKSVFNLECGKDHGGERCFKCGEGWGFHSGHICMDSMRGVFPGCSA